MYILNAKILKMVELAKFLTKNKARSILRALPFYML